MSQVKCSCSAQGCFSSVKPALRIWGDVLYLDNYTMLFASLSIDTFVFFPSIFVSEIVYFIHQIVEVYGIRFRSEIISSS